MDAAPDVGIELGEVVVDWLDSFPERRRSARDNEDLSEHLNQGKILPEQLNCCMELKVNDCCCGRDHAIDGKGWTARTLERIGGNG